MSELPSPARVVVIGAGIVGNSLVYHLARLGLARHRPDRQGPAAQPRRLDRPRVELHLPGRPLARDDRPDARQRAPVQGDGRLHRVAAASRSPAPRSGWRSCAGGCLGQGLGHRGRARHAGAGRTSWSRSSTRRSSSAASGRRASASSTRCAPARIMRERAQELGALTVVAERRGRRPRRRGAAGSAGVRTSGGDIEAETVVIACGVWSPKIARDGRRPASRSPRRCTR